MHADTADFGTSVRARTRCAILDAALELLPARPSATTTEIAAAANVGRTTLHRYFPERKDLLRALVGHVESRSSAAVERADPAAGNAIEAMRRIVDGQLDFGPIMLFLKSDPMVGPDEWLALTSQSDPLQAFLAPGGRLGRTDLPANWASRVFWGLLHTGFSAIAEDGLPRHEAVDAILLTLTEGVLSTPTLPPH